MVARSSSQDVLSSTASSSAWPPSRRSSGTTTPDLRAAHSGPVLSPRLAEDWSSYGFPVSSSFSEEPLRAESGDSAALSGEPAGEHALEGDTAQDDDTPGLPIRDQIIELLHGTMLGAMLHLVDVMALKNHAICVLASLCHATRRRSLAAA